MEITGSKELVEKFTNVVNFIERLNGMQTNGDNLFYQTPLMHDNEEEAKEPMTVQIVKKYIDDEICHLLDQ